MTKAFVAGWPVAHSLSPQLHGYWLQRHAIAGSYQAMAVPPHDFAQFIANLPQSGFAGGNVTIPHKEAAFSLCAAKDGEALAIGAVNTLWTENARVCGTCTDSYGFAANLDDHSGNWRTMQTALVIGAGGAARAVVHALIKAGLSKITIANRTPERADSLAGLFGPKVSAHRLDTFPQLARHANLIINTTSLGMDGQSGEVLSLDEASSDALVTDIVYVPLETPFLAAARLRGLKTIDGLGMLLHQAVPGFERWFGVRPQVDLPLRAHLLAILDHRSRQP